MMALSSGQTVTNTSIIRQSPMMRSQASNVRRKTETATDVEAAERRPGTPAASP